MAIETPIDEARRLSARFDNRILLKREDLQRVAKKYFITDKVHILHYPAAEPKGTESK